jgi:putative FmdB family regulatory protein
MPKYTFECDSCNVRFTRTLKMGEHLTCACPKCREQVPRFWDGQGFSFDFAEGGKAPANSGVTKHDYPTADQAVGRSADKRWAEYREREKVKEKVRERGGSRALNRTDSPEINGNRSYIQYTAIGEKELQGRREVVGKLKQLEPR